MTFQEFHPNEQTTTSTRNADDGTLKSVTARKIKEHCRYFEEKKPPSSPASFYCRTRYQFIWLFLSQRVTKSKKKKKWVGGSLGVVKHSSLEKGREKKSNKCVHSTLTRLKRRKLKGDTVYIEKASSSSFPLFIYLFIYLFFFFVIISFRFCGS